MVDTRFHKVIDPIALGHLLERAGHAALVSEISDPDRMIEGAAELDAAGPADIVFATHRSYQDDLKRTKAGVALVTRPLADAVPDGTDGLVTPEAHAIFADLLSVLYPQDTHRTALAGIAGPDDAPGLEDGVVLGENVALGKRVEIGAGTVIGANTTIGGGVAIGRDCVIGPNCTIECAYLGDKIVLQSGVRIGNEGFGFLHPGQDNKKIPQLGRVIVQDRVEIGANTTVDRGALGDTVIGEGTKIDNLVQIAHNCRIGRNCVISGKAGLAGSTTLGDGVVLAADVGVAGHVTIGAGTVVFARSGVSKSCPPGSKLAGAPAADVNEWRREIGWIRRMSKGSNDGN